jgi:hypothetical protein
MKVTWCGGSAQPPQPAWISTPNGRGRLASMPTSSTIRTVRFERIRKTIRCRQRRSTRSASMSPYSSPLMIHQEPIAASRRQNPTSPGASRPANQLTTASSATVTAIAGPRMPPPKTTAVSATTATTAASQRTPLVCSLRGSGGASPDGRRRRGARWTRTGAVVTCWALVRDSRSPGTSMAPPRRGATTSPGRLPAPTGANERPSAICAAAGDTAAVQPPNRPTRPGTGTGTMRRSTAQLTWSARKAEALVWIATGRRLS